MRTSITDENIEEVTKMILPNQLITVRAVANYVGISFGSYQAIFTHILGMKHVAAYFFPKFLNFEQKQRHKNIAQEMLTTLNDAPDLLKV